jgi:CRP-like cAMP-binding protein
MDHSLGTITPNRVAFIAHEPLRKLIRQQPGIAERLWRETLIDASVFREWITNVGSRDAYTRIAHVICEMYVRLHAVGLTNGTTFQFPITQTELADATGLSTVHVNRSIQQIRADGLIVWERGVCTIPDLKACRTPGCSSRAICICAATSRRERCIAWSVAGGPGFEPRLTVSESPVPH